jgi:hypothetical protein
MRHLVGREIGGLEVAAIDTPDKQVSDTEADLGLR